MARYTLKKEITLCKLDFMLKSICNSQGHVSNSSNKTSVIHVDGYKTHIYADTQEASLALGLSPTMVGSICRGLRRPDLPILEYGKRIRVVKVRPSIKAENKCSGELSNSEVINKFLDVKPVEPIKEYAIDIVKESLDIDGITTIKTKHIKDSQENNNLISNQDYLDLEIWDVPL
jgi:hypothetical protein